MKRLLLSRFELIDCGAAKHAQTTTRAGHIDFQAAGEDGERVRATYDNTEPVDEDLVDRVMLDVACNQPIVRDLRTEYRDGNAAPSHGVLRRRHRESRVPAVEVGRSDRRSAS